MNPSEHWLRITKAHELRQLLTLPAPSAVVLDVASMPSDEAAAWEREINRRLRPCGCDEGTAALLLMWGVLSMVAWLHWGMVSGAPVISAVIAIGCSGLAIAAGKAFGKWRGRRRLADSVHRLRNLLARCTVA